MFYKFCKNYLNSFDIKHQNLFISKKKVKREGV